MPCRVGFAGRSMKAADTDPSGADAARAACKEQGIYRR
jgi:hypothetical protein